jgi:ribosomal protein L32
MDPLAAFAIIAAAGIGLLAMLWIVLRQRRQAAARESPFAMSTEGMKVCPSCGRPNLWTDSTCLHCGRRLPG